MSNVETEHLFSLADSLGAEMRLGELPAGVASWGAFDHSTRTAYVGNHKRTYIVGLHELGHAVVGTDERRAWAWAVTHSARPFTSDERTFASRCLAAYGLDGHGIVC